MQVEGKRIFVTGGANGCGEGIVRGLLTRGARVYATDVDVAGGEALVKELDTDRLVFARLDVSSREDVFASVADAAAVMGGIDGLVNSGGNVLHGPPEDATDEDWDTIFDVHVRGTFFTNQAVFPYLKAAGGGTILNFGSAAAIRGAKSYSIYGAAKGAVFGWTRNLAIEWGEHNIRVNAFAPFMESSLQKQSRESSPEQAAMLDAGVKALTKIRGTLGIAEFDLAPMACLLLGDGGTYITGQVLAVDGGFAMLGS